MSDGIKIPVELPFIPIPKISDEHKSEVNLAFEKEVMETLGNREGVKELGDVLMALFTGLEVYKEAMSNGSIGFEDVMLLTKLYRPVLDAIKGAEKVGKEITDVITEDEIKFLESLIIESSLPNAYKDKVVYGLKALYYIRLCIG